MESLLKVFFSNFKISNTHQENDNNNKKTVDVCMMIKETLQSFYNPEKARGSNKLAGVTLMRRVEPIAKVIF